MANVSWTSAVTGQWSNAADWSTDTVPNGGSAVTIAAVGTYIVTISSTTVASAASLTLSATSATLADSGTLDMGGVFAISAGKFGLDGGTVSGGTIEVGTSGSFVVNGNASLDAVAFDGALTVGSAATLNISGGITLAGSAGTGSATINVTSANGSLDVYGTRTLNSATVNLGNNTGWGYLRAEDPNTPGTLTLGSSLTVVQAGTNAMIQDVYATETLVNNGVISAGIKGGDFNIEDFTQVTNGGSIIIANGDTLDAGTDTDFTNKGTISVTSATVDIGNYYGATINSGVIDVGTSGVFVLSSGSFADPGTINVSSGGVFLIETSVTAAQLGAITVASGGTVELLYGTLFGGGTLNLGSGTLELATDGVISAVTISGGTLVGSGGTLDGVTYLGTLNLAGYEASLTVEGGLNVSTGGASGTINVTGEYASLDFEGTQTINNATLNLGNNNGYSDLYAAESEAGTLTFGSNLAIVAAGTHAQIDYDESGYGATLINRGSITEGVKGGYLYISGSTSTDDVFTNQGTLAAVNSGTIYLETNVTTAGLGSFSTSTGGVIELYGGYTLANSGTTLDVGSTAQLTLAGTISGGTIDDTGSGIVAAGGTLDGVTYLGTLNLAGYEASITVEGGLNVSTGGASGTIDVTGEFATLDFEGTQTINSATINLGNNTGYSDLEAAEGEAGTLTFGSNLAIVAAGKYAQIYYDAGEYGETLINQGSITAGVSGGTLLINGYYAGDVFTNEGSLVAENGATIELNTDVTTSGLGSFSTSTGGKIELESGYTLANSGTTLNVGSAAQLTLAGTISGGTIDDSGSGIVGAGGTLDGVTYLGTLNLTAESASLVAEGGLNVSTGGASGTINVTGEYASLDFEGTQTINDATLNLGNNSATAYLDAAETEAGTLTFGSNLAIVEAGKYAQIYYDYEDYGETLINQGSITAGVSGGTLLINGYYDGDVFTNQGSLVAENNATIELNTDVTTSGLGSFSTSTGGKIELESGYTLANAGTTLDVGSTAQLTLAGTITGGTINDGGSGIIGAGGTLDAVTYLGTLNLTGTGANLAVEGGLNISTGGANGVINVTGTSASLDFEGTQTINDATINLGNNSATDYLYAAETEAGTLTFGSNLAIVEAGKEAQIYFDDDGYGEKLINQGSITAAVSGSIFYIQGPYTGDVFTNDGTIAVSNGATIDIVSTKLGNFASATLTSGIWSVGSGSTLNLGTNTVFTTLAANVTLSGATAVFDVENSGGTVSTLDSHLTTIAATGALSLLAGRNLTTTSAFTDSGSLQLGASSFKAGSIAVTSGGTITGYGSATGAIANSGSIVASGGTLVISSAVTGGGTMQIDGGAVLDLVTPAAETVTFAGEGELMLGSPTGFTGTLAGLAGGDVLFLTGITTATGASIVGGNLVVTLTGGSTLDYAVSGNPAGLDFKVALDGTGHNTIVTAYRYAAASVAPTTIAFGNQHVGATLNQTLTTTNTAATDGYSENLDGSITAGSGATASGSFSGLAAGAASTALSAGLTTTTAGVATGTATVALASDGTGIDGAGTDALPSQTVNLSATLYAYATPSLASSAINFGVVHVGDSVSQALALTDSTTDAAYTEGLDASLSGATAGVTAAGSLTDLAAGATDDSSLLVGLITTGSGAISGTATLGLTSDGTIDGLASTALTSQTVTISGTVDNYAVAAFEDPSGPNITGSGTSYTLNLGSVEQGSAALSVNLGALNTATGLSDLLGGTISTAGATGFTNTGFGSFSGLGAGSGEDAQIVSLATTTAGTFSETITLTAAGSNASGYSGALPTETLTITGTITPAFTTYTLTSGANTITGADGAGDIFIATAASINKNDSLTGGDGANSFTLTGAGTFNFNLPTVLTNIPTINATEGQAASGSDPATSETVDLRNATTETVNVAAGTPASGNTKPETITIKGGTGTDTINLASGTDTVTLGTGSATVTLGGTKNSVTGGGGTAVVQSAIAYVGAKIVGASSGSTTLAITTTGTGTLNAADTDLTVDLTAGTNVLTLGAGSNITVVGTSGTDTFTVGSTSQTVEAGSGTETIKATAALAGATVVGYSQATTTLSITTTSGTATLANSDSNLTVKLAAGTTALALGNGNDLTAILSSASETIDAGSGSQTIKATAAFAAAAITGYSQGATTLAITTTTGTATLNNADSNLTVELSTGTNTLALGNGADLAAIVGAGTETVDAGTGTDTIDETAAFAAAKIVGNSQATTTLDLTTAGTATLSSTDTNLTVNLTAGTNAITLGTLGFITVDGGASGTETITAKAANQTLVSDGATDKLVGYTGDGDIFSGTYANLSHDTITNFAGTDLIDITNLAYSPTGSTWGYSTTTDQLTVSNGSGSAVIKFVGSYTTASFTLSADAGSGTYVHFV